MSGSLSWSVHIVSVAGGAAFQPWVPNSNPGDPTKAQVGDIVTWGNDTNDIHQPWPTVDNKPDGDLIPDTKQSSWFRPVPPIPSAAADRPGRRCGAADNSGPATFRHRAGGGFGDLLLLQEPSALNAARS